jgi:hypothetical protein
MLIWMGKICLFGIEVQFEYLLKLMSYSPNWTEIRGIYFAQNRRDPQRIAFSHISK